MDTSNQTIGAAAQLSGTRPTAVITDDIPNEGLTMNRKNRRTLASLVRRRKLHVAVQKGFNFRQILAEGINQRMDGAL